MEPLVKTTTENRLECVSDLSSATAEVESSLGMLSEAVAASGTVCLEGSLDIASVSERKQSLEALLVSAAEVKIDLRAVERVDTAGLQLLLVMRTEARRRGQSWSWISPSDVVLRGARQLALSEAIGFEEHS